MKLTVQREKCGGHFIRVKVLERMVLKHIQLVTGYILRYEAHFRKDTAPASAGHAVSLLTDHLDLLKHVIFDDNR